MAVLPNARLAVIDERKVRDYLLNPLHPLGRHKARMFAAALGFERSDYRRLIASIREAILVHEGAFVDRTPYGARFRVDTPIAGPSGTALVRTLWIIRTDEDVPRLTSAYPLA